MKKKIELVMAVILLTSAFFLARKGSVLVNNGKAEEKEICIAIDAGHGGDDPGAISGSLKEKDLTLRAAQYMYKRLQELGVPTSIVRDTDETLTRNERIKRMTDPFGNGTDVIIISNHINAGGET